MISPVNRRDVAYVAEHMRQGDKDEIYPLGWDTESIVNEVMRQPDHAWLFRWGPGCDPVAVLGAFLDDGSWDVFMFATDRFSSVAHRVTEFIRSRMIPRLAATGIRHAHCHSLATRKDAHRWLALLKAEPTITLKGMGRNGEDYIRFVWRDTHVLQKQGSERQLGRDRAA